MSFFVLGAGQGSCSAAGGCPSWAPVCSEYGYCQCAGYVRGGPACGPGMGGGGYGGWTSGMGRGGWSIVGGTGKAHHVNNYG